MTNLPLQPDSPLAAIMKQSSLLLVLLLSASAISGCAEDILGSDPSTGLMVTIRKGPIEPVAREGEDNSAPVLGAVVLVEGVGGGDATLRTDGDGFFRVLLDPGDYVVTVQECPDTLGLPDPARVTVPAGSMISVTLECDTGIR